MPTKRHLCIYDYGKKKMLENHLTTGPKPSYTVIEVYKVRRNEKKPNSSTLKGKRNEQSVFFLVYYTIEMSYAYAYCTWLRCVHVCVQCSYMSVQPQINMQPTIIDGVSTG